MKNIFTIKNLLKTVGVLNLGTAISIWLFWYNFYTGALFKIEELRPLIANFDGYYSWEISFTIPDILTSIFMFLAGIVLFFQPFNKKARFVLTLTTGAILFLGVLDFNYSINNGMYTMNHSFAKDLMEAGIGLPMLAIFNIVILSLANKSQN